MVQLVHIHGPMKGDIREFSEDLISIGRNPGSSLRFPREMTSLSRRHAEISREGNQFKLTDYSANGTFVNGKRVKETLLREGDVLEFSEGGPKVSFLIRKSEAVVEGEKKAFVTEESGDMGGKAVAGEEACGPSDAGVAAGIEQRPETARLSRSEITDDSGRREGNHVELSSRKIKAPLIIQFGPTIRSYSELPVIIGNNAKSDFVLPLPLILEQHVQILYSSGKYWIKDLSGLNHVRINGNPIEFQVSLNLNDMISLTHRGPVFCYLGEGRFAEVTEPGGEATSKTQKKENAAARKAASGDRHLTISFLSKLKEMF